MCLASDYKSPITPWQFFFCCFGETFSYMLAKLSGTPHFWLPSCLATLLLPPSSLETILMSPIAFPCVNFPLAAPQFSETFYFPKGNHQMLRL